MVSNRHQRRTQQAQARKQKKADPPYFRKAAKGATIWYWVVSGGVAACKDLWSPLGATVSFFNDQPWLFPCLWGLSILTNYIWVGQERERQHKYLKDIRYSPRKKGKR